MIRTLGGTLLVGIIAAGAIAAGVALGLRAPAPPATTAAAPAPTPRHVKKPVRTLDVNVGWSATVVKITNNGTDNVGQPMEVYVNGQPPFAFRADTTVPPQGLFVMVPLSQFVNRDGERFNPVTRGVTVVWVGGGGYDFQSYGRN